jgi:4-hydroxybenzoate polyprenyltransferase
MRPANIVTAWADILAGFAVTHFIFYWIDGSGSQYQLSSLNSLLWLMLSTTGLYGGGVVFNDVFDAKLDKIERPERPIPSGRASKTGATWLGVFLLVIGVIGAFQVNSFSGKLAIVIAIAALNYDRIAKHNAFVGPINMGLCRGLNLMLGMSAAYEAVYNTWFICFIPILFIGAITMISRFEVSGGNRNMIVASGIMFSIVIIYIASIGFFAQHKILQSIPFLIIFIGMVYTPLFRAFKEPSPKNIRASVKGGILSLIPMNAAIAAGFAGILYGFCILLLLPLSIYLARKFAVT